MLQQADELAGARHQAAALPAVRGLSSGSFRTAPGSRVLQPPAEQARVACASTGNTSAAMAVFARQAKTPSGIPIQAVVFVGSGKIAYGKLAQALDYGAKTVQIDGDFDACMSLVQQTADRLNLYLMNSVNPFRLEGQKTMYACWRA
jgi:threonine synthase